MAGEAKSNAFMLGTATVMIGPQADLLDLNPEDHSIGLVKNFTIMMEPGYTELTQGVKNSIVFSVMTSNPVKANMEVYEYTAKNIAYATGLDGSALVAQSVATTTSAAALANATSIVVVSTTGLTVGSYIQIQEGNTDKVNFRKIASVDTATKTLTLSSPLKAPLASGAYVTKVNTIDIGSKEDQPFLAAKIIGTLANGDEVGILIPKLRVTNGFNMGFVTDNFGNMPFEFTLYDLIADDPNYAEFAGKQAIYFTKK